MSAEVLDDFSEDEDDWIEADKNFNIRALATSFVNYALELKGYEKERVNERFECPKLLKKLRFLIYDKPCIENNKDEHIDNVENMFLKSYTKIDAAIKFIYCYERYFDVVAELFAFENRDCCGYYTIIDYVNGIKSIARKAIDDYIKDSESIDFFESWTEKMKEYRVLEASDFYLTDNLKSNIELVKRLIEATSDSSKEVPQEEDILKFSSLSENDMNAIYLMLREENLQESIDRITNYIDEIKSET